MKHTNKRITTLEQKFGKMWLSKTKKSRKRILDTNPINLRIKMRDLILSEIDKIKCDNLEHILYIMSISEWGEKKISRGLHLLGSGASGIAFDGCMDIDCNLKIVTKISKIYSSPAFNYTRKTRLGFHPIKCEIKLLIKFTKDILLKNISPHFSLYYGDFDCASSIIKKIPTTSPQWLNKFNRDIDNGDILDKVKLLIVEQSSNDLDRITRQKLTGPQWYAILFQICHMLALAQYYVPGFRHNDLKLDNILVDVFPLIENTYYHYKMFDKDYYLPNIGIRIKMWDLDFACCEAIKNQKVEDDWSNTFGCTSLPNPIYDLHSLLNITFCYNEADLPVNIIKVIKKYLTTKDPKLVSKFSKSASQIDLSGYQSLFTKYGRLTGNTVFGDENDQVNVIPNDMPSPADLLIDPKSIFKRFLKKPKLPNKIIKVYDTKIPNNTAVRKRKDMFNVFINT